MRDGFVEPDFLTAILAKSADRSEDNIPETLARHTWLVVKKVAELAKIRPDLTVVANTADLWHLLYWGCFLHDFGKATGGFQQQLQGISWNGHRHEVISLVFLDWIAANFPKHQQTWLAAAIASHHRDRGIIQEKYLVDSVLIDAWSTFELTNVPLMWRWLTEYANQWIGLLGLDAVGVRPLQFPNSDQAIQQVQADACSRIRYWLRQYYRLKHVFDDEPEHAPVPLLILLRGLTTTADHMASAHLAAIPQPIQENWQALAKRILSADQQPYSHQQQSADAHSTSCLLIAPTGSGKTEAALYWALGEGNQSIPRIFYALPFQASMNAMFDRLRQPEKGFGEQAVGLQHGRALQVLYLRLLESEHGLNSRTAAEKERWERNINSLHARPLKVFSPYQMLKALFQIKGFEAILSDYAQARFIFDEIHAYEPKRLALIICLINYLSKHFAATFFVMSATFPTIIRQHLAKALGQHQVIQASASLFQAFARHRLQLLDGELISASSIKQIINDFKAGKQVLVCANTVRRAQTILALLRDAGVAESDLLLIHSRFTMKDRSALEQRVIQRCQLGLAQPEPFILIATQVIEVSLNIDLDALYSDPAPLEALLQRFGRVNRSRKKGIVPVHVFREPRDGQGVYGRNKDPKQQGRIVQVTLSELEKHNGEIIDESMIDQWLDTIYADPILTEQWQDAYQKTYDDAQWIADNLRPFESDKTTEDQFDELFDNVDVIPQSLVKTYLDLLNNHEYVESSRYFVGISKQKYAQFKRDGLILALEDAALKYPRWIINLPYSSESGLSFDQTAIDDDWS